MSLLKHKFNLNVTFFGIPEISSQISKYLNKHDLSVCVRVSKSWHHSFISTLWRKVKIYSSVHYPSPSAVSKHASLIRSMLIEGELPPKILISQFTCLQKLEIHGRTTKPCTFSPLILVRNPAIEHVIMGFDHIHILDQFEFWDALLSLQHLKTVSFIALGLPSKSANMFWKLICRLDSASIHRSEFPSSLFSLVTSPCQLKHLTLNSTIANQQTDLMFVAKSTGLEELNGIQKLKVGYSPKCSKATTGQICTILYYTRLTWITRNSNKSSTQ